MRSRLAEPRLAASPAALPPEARALLTGGFFDTVPWYETTCRAAVPAGARPVFLAIEDSAGIACVVPMLRHGRAASALTTPYTCLWRPLGGRDLSADRWRHVGRVLGGWCRGFGTTRLDAFDPGEAWVRPLLAGAREAGLAALRFDHFGNWFIGCAAGSWDDYLAARPGALRTAIRRRTARLMNAGASFRMERGGPGLEAAIAGYEAVYAKSWKAPEPFPLFNAALMRACAADGSLRLGLLERGGRVLAAQFWVVRAHWASVLKLAHDEAEAALSPGTVLTAQVIRSLLTEEGVRELDFGRGDDAYKADWTGARRQRVGVVLANPRHPAGLVAILRAAAGRGVRHVAALPRRLGWQSSDLRR